MLCLIIGIITVKKYFSGELYRTFKFIRQYGNRDIQLVRKYAIVDDLRRILASAAGSGSFEGLDFNECARKMNELCRTKDGFAEALCRELNRFTSRDEGFFGSVRVYFYYIHGAGGNGSAVCVSLRQMPVYETGELSGMGDAILFEEGSKRTFFDGDRAYLGTRNLSTGEMTAMDIEADVNSLGTADLNDQMDSVVLPDSYRR